ncbi:hypothetical protein [Persicirhabdus sediminis]|uniref:Uncharacterized protein n=1 Tax=Persicirhabdus sediminis TaxID=454144 RepID=A0A8J7MFA2_9BACT|nr:hypothetical protein [Persicirhabdus sediminis]MBK1791662.1 hypothetical protein [Persicirhabdus sediminis]
MSDVTPLQQEIEDLVAKVMAEPDNWPQRREAALGLSELKRFEEAADLVWSAPEVPSTDDDIVFTCCMLAQAPSRNSRCIRLIQAVLEQNKGKPTKNMAIAGAMMKYGMLMQAARFYGIALQEDEGLVNPELEKFFLWLRPTNQLKRKGSVADPVPSDPNTPPLMGSSVRTSTGKSTLKPLAPKQTAPIPLIRPATPKPATTPQPMARPTTASTPIPIAQKPAPPAQPAVAEKHKPVKIKPPVKLAPPTK